MAALRSFLTLMLPVLVVGGIIWRVFLYSPFSPDLIQRFTALDDVHENQQTKVLLPPYDSKTLPKRKGKLLVLGVADELTGTRSPHPDFKRLPETIRASNDAEVGTVVVVSHSVANAGGYYAKQAGGNPLNTKEARQTRARLNFYSKDGKFTGTALVGGPVSASIAITESGVGPPPDLVPLFEKVGSQ